MEKKQQQQGKYVTVALVTSARVATLQLRPLERGGSSPEAGVRDPPTLGPVPLDSVGAWIRARVHAAKNGAQPPMFTQGRWGRTVLRGAQNIANAQMPP